MYLSKNDNELCLYAIKHRKVKVDRKDHALDIRNIGMPAAIKRHAEVIAEAIAAQSSTSVVPVDAALITDDGEIIWYYAIPIPADLDPSRAHATARLHVLLQRPETPDTVKEIAECAALTGEKAMTVLQERIVSKLPKKSGSLVAVPFVVMRGETKVITHEGELREKPDTTDPNPLPFSDRGQILGLDRPSRTFTILLDPGEDDRSVDDPCDPQADSRPAETTESGRGRDKVNRKGAGSGKRQKPQTRKYSYDPETIGDQVAALLTVLKNHTCVHGEKRQGRDREVRDAIAVEALSVKSDAAKESRNSAARKRSSLKR
jgi:hypothetical protein